MQRFKHSSWAAYKALLGGGVRPAAAVGNEVHQSRKASRAGRAGTLGRRGRAGCLFCIWRGATAGVWRRVSRRVRAVASIEPGTPRPGAGSGRVCPADAGSPHRALASPVQAGRDDSPPDRAPVDSL